MRFLLVAISLSLLLLSFGEQVEGFLPHNHRNSRHTTKIVRHASDVQPSEDSDFFFPSPIPPRHHEAFSEYYHQRKEISMDDSTDPRQEQQQQPQLDHDEGFLRTWSSTERWYPHEMMYSRNIDSYTNESKKPTPILLPILTVTNTIMFLLLVVLSSASSSINYPESSSNDPVVVERTPITRLQQPRTTIEQDFTPDTYGSSELFFFFP